MAEDLLEISNENALEAEAVANVIAMKEPMEPLSYRTGIFPKITRV